MISTGGTSPEILSLVNYIITSFKRSILVRQSLDGGRGYGLGNDEEGGDREGTEDGRTRDAGFYSRIQL